MTGGGNGIAVLSVEPDPTLAGTGLATGSLGLPGVTDICVTSYRNRLEA